MRQLGNAWAQMLGKPSLLVRELTLAVRGSAQGYYEALGDDVLETQDGGFRDPNKPLWLNLGYWERARTYPEAAADLARKLGRAARLGKGDTVLDAGFGYGEQDLLWVNEFDVARIVGVNVTALHVDRAKARVAARGLSDRIDLRLGSATEIPLEAGSVDKVVALESAFHFDTREKFFAEAMRVLKPGGRLATADCVPYVGEKPGGFIQRMAWRRWGVPVANVYDREAYRAARLHADRDRVDPQPRLPRRPALRRAAHEGRADRSGRGRAQRRGHRAVPRRRRLGARGRPQRLRDLLRREA
jgi:microcystin synthetase protein McyJ